MIRNRGGSHRTAEVAAEPAPNGLPASKQPRKPDDPKSTDPNAEVRQLYTQKKPSGGFLRITIGPGSKVGTGEANFTFVDEHGKVLYETTKIR